MQFRDGQIKENIITTVIWYNAAHSAAVVFSAARGIVSSPRDITSWPIWDF